MRIISFQHTSAPLLAGAKTCTRREWQEGYALSFHAGDLVRAYDRSPRQHGQQIATIRLTQAPYLENIANAPDSDWEAEGFAWLDSHPEHIPPTWRRWDVSRQYWHTRCLLATPLLGLCAPWHRPDLWVVRFEVVEVTP